MNSPTTPSGRRYVGKIKLTPADIAEFRMLLLSHPRNATTFEDLEIEDLAAEFDETIAIAYFAGMLRPLKGEQEKE